MKNVNNNLIELTLIIFFSFFTYVNAVEFRGAAFESYKGASSKKKINVNKWMVLFMKNFRSYIKKFETLFNFY